MHKALLFILLVELILSLTSVSAEDYAEYWGEVTLDGNSVPNGLSVRAYIDSQQYARMPGGTLNGYYYLRIPEDNINTQEKEGGVDEDEIIVKIDGIETEQNLQFRAPFLGRFDLSIGCVPNWDCTDFSSCSIDGKKSRTCTDLNGCGGSANKPDEVVNCEYSPGDCGESWQCFEWSPCSNNIQTRVCIDVNECGTSVNIPPDSRTCDVACAPYWQCTDFSSCSIDGKKSRTCTDINQCNNLINKPIEIIDCEYEEPEENKNSGGSKKSGKDSSNDVTDIIYLGIVGTLPSSKNGAVLGDNNNKKIKSILNLPSNQSNVAINKKNKLPILSSLLGIMAVLYLIMIVLTIIAISKMKRFIRKKAYLHFMEMHQNPFKIIVKPNSPKNKFLGYDKDKEAYRIAIKAKPEANKANIEIIKFFSKLLKKRVRIIKGLKSKEKIIKIE